MLGIVRRSFCVAVFGMHLISLHALGFISALKQTAVSEVCRLGAITQEALTVSGLNLALIEYISCVSSIDIVLLECYAA